MKAAPLVQADVQTPKSGVTLDEAANCENEVVSEIKTPATFDK